MREPRPQDFDFHCHSTASDGSLAPAELVARAAACGVRKLALTDHDTLAGLPEARRSAREAGVELVTGIEWSVQWQGRELHLLGLGMDAGSQALRELEAGQQEARRLRAQKIGARLNQATGLTDSYERVAELAGTDAPGRPWFARMLVSAGHARDMGHAFSRFLRQGQCAFVRTPWVDLDQAVGVVGEAGGVAVLAHPVRYGLTRRKLRGVLAALCEAGGGGLEVAMPGLNADQQRLLDECLRDFPLCASGGSDFHSPEQKWLELGRLPDFPEGADTVLERLERAA